MRNCSADKYLCLILHVYPLAFSIPYCVFIIPYSFRYHAYSFRGRAAEPLRFSPAELVD